MLSKKEIVLTIYMKEILETHPVTNLKSILRNIKGDIGSYSKMKKAELIDSIMELKKKGFPVPNVEKYVKPERKKVTKKPAPVQGPNNLVKGFGIKKKVTQPSSPRQVEMLNFRNRALLPLINEKGHVQNDKEGQKYLKSELDFLQKEYRRLLVGATKQEKKALGELMRIFGIGITLSEKNKFDDYLVAIKRTIQLSNQDLKKANLPPITFKGK